MDNFSVLAYLHQLRSHIKEHLSKEKPELWDKVKSLENDREDGKCQAINCASVGDVVEMLEHILSTEYPKLPQDFALHSGKSAQKSVEHRETGNELLKKGRLCDALKEYNSAVVAAPKEGNTLALALSNRAVCYSKMAKHDLAAKDTMR